MKHKCPRCEILPRSLKGVGGIKSKLVKDNWGTTLRIFVWNISVRENRTTFSDGPLLPEITELKQRRRWKQRERQKTNSFGLKKQQLCTCIMLFVHFFYRRCTATTWKFLISRFVEDVNTRQRLSFSFPELWCVSFRIQLKKVCQHLTNETRWNKSNKVCGRVVAWAP